MIFESAIEESREAAKALRRRLGMTEDTFWFGLVGGIGAWKNPSLVVRAVVAANQRVTQRLGLAVIGQWRTDPAWAVAEAELRAGGGSAL